MMCYGEENCVHMGVERGHTHIQREGKRERDRLRRRNGVSLERAKEREGERGRQTDLQIETESERKGQRQGDIERYRPANRHTDIKTDRQIKTG